MVFFKHFFVKIILSVVIVSFLIVAPFPLFSKINQLNYSFNGEINLKYSGVLELWNVDTFEGGSVSRTTFLEKRALEFEKQNKGVFISVNNISLEQLKLNLNSGKLPSIITFGIGAGEYIVNELKTLNTNFFVREDLIKSAVINGQIKAVPIMMGGYSLILNKELVLEEDFLRKNEFNNSIVYSTKDNINPLLSLFVNNIQIKKQCEENLTSFDAYDKFIHNKYEIILGTQRDYYRCKNRENNLKMQGEYKLLAGFTDLIVYAGVCKSDSVKEEISENFISYLTSKNVQEKLQNINLFPVINENIYIDEDYKNFNNVLLKNVKTLNVFSNNETLSELKNLLIKYFNGEVSLKKEIENYLL